MYALTMPAYGMAMTEGEVVAWRKAEGDWVESGETIAEIETDKTTADLVAPVSGRVSSILVPAGELANVGATLCTIQEASEAEAARPAGVEPAVMAPDAPAAVQPESVQPAAPAEPVPAIGTSTRPIEIHADGRPHRLTPRQRAAAGRPRTAAIVPEPPAEPSAPAAGGVRDYRRAIAERVTRSWMQTPHFSVVKEIDCWRLTETHRAARADGSLSTITDYFMLALARSLGRLGLVTTSITLAVDTEGGVVSVTVPIDTDVGVAAVAGPRADAIDRVRNGALRPDDLTPTGPAMLSNLGTHGVDQFVGVLPIGQPLLLTLGAIRNRVVASGSAIRVTPTVFATVTADHRAFDGADVARLLGYLDHELNATP